MTETFTDENLLLYHYNELSPQQAESIRRRLQRDIDLRLRYENLISPLGLLENTLEEPNPTSVRIIMEHAAQFGAGVAAD